MEPYGIYIHVPFCGQKCPYCDFYSLSASEETKNSYIRALLSDLERYRNQGLTADTLYFGGGTPSLLSVGQLSQLVDKVREIFSLSGEITLEANPGTVKKEQLYALQKAGFNRISFGMQSAVKKELELLGRTHSPDEVSQAVDWAREAGFDNISVDLMLGIPLQTRESCQVTLSFAEHLGVDHISAYLLKVEERTRFNRKEIFDLLPDEDSVCDFYLLTCETLKKIGLFQYEISNFARPGRESKHNLKYWERVPYLGFGPSAHSFDGTKRFYYSRSLSDYLAHPGKHLLTEEERVDPLEEYVLLGLRLSKGISISYLENQFGIDPKPVLLWAKPYLSHNLIKICNNRLFCTPEGFLLSNTIIASLLSFIAKDTSSTYTCFENRNK